MISQDAFTSGRSLIGTILSKMNNIGKVRYNFLLHILMMYLSMRGRINFLQLGRYGHRDEHTYRNQFNEEFDWAQFNRLMVTDYCSDEMILEQIKKQDMEEG